MAAHVCGTWARQLSTGATFGPDVPLFGRPLTPEELEQMSRKLDDYALEQSDSTYLKALRNSPLANNLRQDSVRFSWGEADVIYDQPEKLVKAFNKTKYHLAPKLEPYFNGVSSELIIISPYFSIFVVYRYLQNSP